MLLGQRVRLQGLVRASNLNGQLGTVEEAGAERATVRLESGRTISAKLENITLQNISSGASSSSAVQPAGLISDARDIQPVSAARPALQLSSSKPLEAARKWQCCRQCCRQCRLQSASGSAEQPASAGPSTDSGCESESAAGDAPAWTPYRQDLGLGLGLRPVPKKIALDLWPKSMCWTCGREDCESQSIMCWTCGRAECEAKELALSDERMEEWEEEEKKEQEETEA